MAGIRSCEMAKQWPYRELLFFGNDLSHLMAAANYKKQLFKQAVHEYCQTQINMRMTLSIIYDPYSILENY